MASAKFEREYSQHLVEQVLRGKMTRRQMLVRASVFGLSLTAAGQLLAACGGDDGGTAASPSASGAPEPVMGGNLKWIGPAPITDPDPVTIYDQGGIVLVYQFLEYLIDLNDDNSLRGQARRELDAERRGRRVDLQAALRRHVQRRQPLRRRGRGHEHGARPGSRQRLRRSLAAQRRALARRRQGHRRPHRRVQPRQALRRLPVHGVLRQLQHRHPAAQLQGRHHQEPGRHRPVHARSVHAQAEGHVQEEPHLLGQGRAGSSAAVPGHHRVHHGRGQRRPEPAAAVGSHRPPAADRLPGRSGAVPGSQSARGHLPRHRHPRGRLQHHGRAVERRQRQAAPSGRRLLPRPRGHQPGPVRRPQQPRLRHLLGSDRVRRQPARARGARPGLRQGQGAAHRGRHGRRHRRSSSPSPSTSRTRSSPSSSRSSASRPASPSSSTSSATTRTTRATTPTTTAPRRGSTPP